MKAAAFLDSCPALGPVSEQIFTVFFSRRCSAEGLRDELHCEHSPGYNRSVWWLSYLLWAAWIGS